MDRRAPTRTRGPATRRWARGVYVHPLSKSRAAAACVAPYNSIGPAPPDTARRRAGTTTRSMPPPPTRPSRQLETFPNPAPERDYLVHIEVPEFTCLCPLTGQPDFATIVLDYIPDARNVELKSLKLYMWSYRDEGVFREAVTNRILDDLVA